ncbi:MAG: dTMP kinase [Spirochaetaceae bacterium]|jgi:dTMP kinase|nr:dTMP kinase [Spirochaetaceae bacterium]
MVLPNFIVFEGIDGAGTSTQWELLKKRAGRDWFFTAEPTAGPAGVFLRRLLGGAESVEAGTMVFLFAADRYEHLYGAGGILEALQAGKTVVSDRYLFSSLAYQSVGLGDSLPRLVNSSFPLPKHLFYFRINVDAALARIAGRPAAEIYEKRDFLEKTAAAYDRVIASYEAAPPEEAGQSMHIHHLNAQLPAAHIAEQIRTILSVP